MESLVEKVNNKDVSNFTQKLESLQNLMIANNDKEGVYGDGINLVENDVFQISHDYCGPLYMRKMIMPKDSVVVSACLLYTSPSPRDRTRSRMPSSA